MRFVIQDERFSKSARAVRNSPAALSFSAAAPLASELSAASCRSQSPRFSNSAAMLSRSARKEFNWPLSAARASCSCSALANCALSFSISSRRACCAGFTCVLAALNCWFKLCIWLFNSSASASLRDPSVATCVFKASTWRFKSETNPSFAFSASCRASSSSGSGGSGASGGRSAKSDSGPPASSASSFLASWPAGRVMPGKLILGAASSSGFSGCSETSVIRFCNNASSFLRCEALKPHNNQPSNSPSNCANNSQKAKLKTR